jgi:hypothetical protein
VVPTAVDVVVFVEVYEVDEYLFAHAAHEARGMPRRHGSHSARRHRHVAGLQDFLTLEKKKRALVKKKIETSNARTLTANRTTGWRLTARAFGSRVTRFGESVRATERVFTHVPPHDFPWIRPEHGGRKTGFENKMDVFDWLADTRRTKNPPCCLFFVFNFCPVSLKKGLKKKND